MSDVFVAFLLQSTAAAYDSCQLACRHLLFVLSAVLEVYCTDGYDDE